METFITLIRAFLVFAGTCGMVGLAIILKTLPFVLMLGFIYWLFFV